MGGRELNSPIFLKRIYISRNLSVLLILVVKNVSNFYIKRNCAYTSTFKSVAVFVSILFIFLFIRGLNKLHWNKSKSFMGHGVITGL